MLIHSWRWFGPPDRISLKQIVQTGAENIVSALHDIPTGEVWESADIRERKRIITDAGLQWTVVESVPVHEDIKTRSGRYIDLIENFKQTLINLGQEEINTVCYNFMPALDWSRTDLKFKFEDGAESLYFNYVHFAAIDIYILQRAGAELSYPPDVQTRAREFYNDLDVKTRENLKNTFLLGFPGSGESFTLKQVRERIKVYEGIDKNEFRSNLEHFLKEVVPVAENAGIRLAIHPDDPPWPLLGMPRLMSTLEDAEYVIKIIDSPSNGITFCTGSFGAAISNDLYNMIDKLAPKINFAHLRNVVRDEGLNFHEDYFFDGDVDMYRIMKTLVKEDKRRDREEGNRIGIPLRPDHGAQILGDVGESNYPGYSLYGRMKNLAEIRGLEIGIRKNLEENHDK
ncbi:MAG TPA: mannonate dehydratase [Bacteroides sp.]|nr:mannonate dehydratase [Bacteroides sp.]